MIKTDFNKDLITQFCRDYKIEASIVESLISFSYGPKDLTRFNLVIKCLEGITENVLSKNCGLGAPNEVINNIEKILEVKNLVINDVKKEWSKKGESDPANLIGHHPEYAMLVQKEKLKDEKKLLHKWHLSWAVLIATRQYRNLGDRSIIELNDSIDRATREVRKLDAINNWPKALPPLIQPNQALEDYIDKFETYLETSDGWGKEIFSLFKSLKESKSRIHRVSSGRKTSIHTSVIKDETPELQSTPKSVTLISAVSKKNVEHEKQGLAKDELTTPKFFRIKEKSGKFSAAGTIRNQIYRQRAKLNSIQSNNQLLLHSWQTPTPHELRCLLKGLDSKLIEDEIRALIYLLLWTGRKLNLIINCQQSNHAKFNKLKNVNSMYWISVEQLLVIPVQGPSYDSEFNQKLVSDKRVDGKQHVEKGYFFVKLPPAANKALCSLSEKSTSKQLFSSDERQATEKINAFFSELNKNSICDLRLSTERLIRTLPNALKATGASHAEILLITNHRYTHAERSLSYYHTTPHHLESSYNHAVHWLKGYITGTAPSSNQESSANNTTEIVLGARYRMTKKLAKFLTQHMLKELNSTRALYAQFTHKDKSQKLIQFHNQLTYYTVKMFQFSSGFRAVNDPLENINLVDLQTGFISISDKDGDSFRHSRIVQLSPRCMEQINAYALHLKNLSKHSKNANLLNHLDLVFDEPEKTKFGFLFYLDDDQRPVKATADQMNEYAIHGLPNNIYRHFLRTELQQNDVSAESISYFLGHWELGEEPFQKFSTLSPIEFCSEVTPVIQALQVELGWTVQHGVR